MRAIWEVPIMGKRFTAILRLGYEIVKVGNILKDSEWPRADSTGEEDENAKPLSFPAGSPAFWAIVDVREPIIVVNFAVFVTREPIDFMASYIGSFEDRQSSEVRHLFRIPEGEKNFH